MHELSIAMSIVEQTEQIRKEQSAQKVVRVFLRLGILSGVEHESLAFSFPLAAAGTGTAEAELIINSSPVKLRCGICGSESASDNTFLICRACGSDVVRLISGQELVLESLELE